MFNKLWNDLVVSKSNKRKSMDDANEELPAKRHLQSDLKEENGEKHSISFGKVARLAAKEKPADKKERGLMRPSVQQINIKKMGIEGTWY